MDEFFKGLDGRLRMSGMLADSIMMGIVNSAMENAYKNSCSKEGELVRLNEKSRFCELATMQLEWCLKFLQEETEDSNIVESTCDREKLLSDLLLTRDRIHNRLKETELMIAEKDRELSEITEIELDLRLALEGKDAELGLEGEKHKRSKKSMEKISGEVKSCVDEQVRKIKAKLEDGEHNLKSLMRRISSRSLDFDTLISEFDADREEGSQSNLTDENSTLMLEGVQSLNLEVEFREMAMDVDILKEKIDSSFKIMASSVSLFKTMLDEQRWMWNAERDATDIIIRSFLREVQYKFIFDPVVHLEAVSSMPNDIDWVAFMDDIANLHEEVGRLVLELDTRKLGNEVSLEGNKSFFWNYDVRGSPGQDVVSDCEGDVDCSSMFDKVVSEKPTAESPSCLSVAQKIKSHEFFIQKKALEIDSLKGEKSRDKDFSPLRSERNFNSVKDISTRVIALVEPILKERANIIAYYDNLRWKVQGDQISLQNSLRRSILGEENPRVFQYTGDMLEDLNSSSCCSMIRSKLSEEIQKLEEEKEDLDMKSVMLEDTYSIIFTGLTRRLHNEYVDSNINTQTREDIYRNILSEMIKEWSDDMESYYTEKRFMEETYNHVLTEVVRDVCCAKNTSTRNSYGKDLPFHDSLFQSSHIDRSTNAVQEPYALPTHFNEARGLKHELSSVSAEPDTYLDIDHRESGEPNQQDDAFTLENEKSGKIFEELTFNGLVSKKDSSSNLPDDEGEPHDQVTSAVRSMEDVDQPSLLHAGHGGGEPNEFQLTMMSLNDFSKQIIDFEIIACGKIKTNLKRYCIVFMVSILDVSRSLFE